MEARTAASAAGTDDGGSEEGGGDYDLEEGVEAEDEVQEEPKMKPTDFAAINKFRKAAETRYAETETVAEEGPAPEEKKEKEAFANSGM